MYAGLMLLSVPDAFTHDLQFTLARLNTMTVPEQFDTMIQNYTVHLASGFWFPLGVMGVFLLRPARLRLVVALAFLLSFFILGRTVALFNLSFYYMIPHLPLIALGVAAAVLTGVRLLWQWTDDSRSPLGAGVSHVGRGGDDRAGRRYSVCGRALAHAGCS